MVNTEQFTARLNKVIDYYDLSAASFADKIDVGRSSISHILSGRNKPSLDFVLKVIAAFPEVELYWLLNGKGNFPKQETPTPTSEKISQENEKQKITPGVFSKNSEALEGIAENAFNNENKQIQRVVIFYNDGTFEAYEKST